jgi:glycosyltransferase involved in cell wall biosynthesis
MNLIEQSNADVGAIQRLAARYADHWAEHRRLAESLADIEASTAWAIARRLSLWRHRLVPDGSWRQKCLRLGLRTLHPRQGRRASEPPSLETASTPASSGVAHNPQRTGEQPFRVAFIGSGADCEAQSMRYRAHNIIAALALVGHEALFVPLEQVQANLDTILSYDLIVLVRLMHNAVTTSLIESAHKLGLPIVYDIDDYLFDPWVMPYVEAFRVLRQSEALRILDELGGCLQACDYFTGSTSYLSAMAALRGKKSFVIHNGLNASQLRLSQLALEQRSARPRDGLTRIGYFSGTRTHQADFRVVYPALMALLRDDANARLAIVGDLDIGEFPGLAPYLGQIDILPLRPWSELPATMAAVDINLIPLELTPFNEGKSNLKYFEAGLLKVPSIASPTRINRESIEHGRNGLLARTEEEWHAGLKELVASAERREQMGQQAFEHVLRTYAPLATAAEVLEVYRQIIHDHRMRRSLAA